MILLEVRTALRRANKYDLFTGDLETMRAKQAVKDNVTVFQLHDKTKVLSGPKTVFSYHDFVETYHKMAFGLLGVITEMPTVVTNEFLFDLVLREASIDDLKDTPRHIKLNRIYYTYAAQKLLGPFYIDNSTTSLFLENLVAKKQIFVPNERQHFKKRELKNVG
jgi:hypothetical protein